MGSPVALAGGAASLVVSNLPVAGSPHQITAYYSGDDNNNPSDNSANPLVQDITASQTVCGQTNVLLSIADNHNGTFTLTFVGTPQADYCVLASTNAGAPPASWLPVAGSTNTVTNLSGVWQFVVTNTAPAQFYRGTAVVPCP